MWAKSVTQFLIIQTLLILQISYGMPTSEEISNLNTTESDAESQADVNSSFLASVSILLTVLSPNDTTTTTPLFANVNATVEPDYDDYNATSHSLSEAEDDLDSLSINGSSNTTHSSLLPLLITDEMEMADSLDDSVTATLMLQEDHSSINIGSSTASSDEDAGDSIIIASMSSNLSPNTAPSPNSATVATEAGDMDEESSRSDDYSSSESSSLLPYVEMLL